mmetsp:Transcript_39239/g.37651  ORF Transcript_39239/g.37651 Transcript_39239/m.37651 type:complete len:186 (-) Transcript_39239:19-576(-)
MEDGKPKWDRVTCAEIINMEVYSLDPSIYTIKWNMSVVTFTKNYIFKKQLSKGQKPSFINILSTWMFSGLWHGFYWVNFELNFCIGMLILLEKYVHQMAPLADPYLNKYAKYFIFYFLSRLEMSYILSAYFLYNHEHSTTLRKAFYFIPDILFFGAIIILVVTGLPGKIQKKYGPIKLEEQARKN